MIVLSQAGASIGSKQDTNQDPPPPHEHNAKEINTNEVSTEEIIHWYFHPLPLQALIALPNQNKTLKLVNFWDIHASIAYGPSGVDVS